MVTKCNAYSYLKKEMHFDLMLLAHDEGYCCFFGVGFARCAGACWVPRDPWSQGET